MHSLAAPPQAIKALAVVEVHQTKAVAGLVARDRAVGTEPLAQSPTARVVDQGRPPVPATVVLVAAVPAPVRAVQDVDRPITPPK